MLKVSVCILLFQVALATSLAGQTMNLKEIRKDFKVGHKDSDLCKLHLAALEEHARMPVEEGYEAAYQMFMAAHTGNPFKKMGHFKKGKKMLEDVIKENPSNVELRYIRLCIQYYIPGYLGYKDSIEEDKAFLVNNLYKLKDEQVKDLIYTYLKGAKMYTDDELALLGR